MKDKVTILTTTHYVASTNKQKGYRGGNHDRKITNTNLIRSTIEDLYKKIGRNDLEHIISLDHDESNEGSIEYLNNLRELEKEFPSVKLIVTTQGIYHSIKNLIDEATTPYYLWFEHDWQFIKDMDLNTLIDTLETDNTVHYIRFNKRFTQNEGCDSNLWPKKNSKIPLVGTDGWSNNPYFCRRSTALNWYTIMDETKKGIIGDFGDKYDPTIEVFLQDYSRNLLKDKKHEEWDQDLGIYILGKLNDPPVIKHINGRNT